MDNITAFIFANHKDIMEFIFAHYDIKYVENALIGDSKFYKYYNGKIVFQPNQRTLYFSEVTWRYGQKIPDDVVMTYITFGNFGNAPEIIEKLVNKFGGCAKNKNNLTFLKDIDKMSAVKLLDKGF